MLFHITSVATADAILREGLRGREGSTRFGIPLGGHSIFVVTSDQIELCDDVAIGQVWPNQDIVDYAIIAIEASGVTGKVKSDDVAESTASMHGVILQELIEPQYLTLHRIRELNYPHSKLQELTSKSDWTDEDMEIADQWNPLLAAIIRGENPLPSQH